MQLTPQTQRFCILCVLIYLKTAPRRESGGSSLVKKWIFLSFLAKSPRERHDGGPRLRAW